MLTVAPARYCSGKYPQLSFSTDCFARPYQQIITISINCTIKGKLKKGTVLGGFLPDIGYHGTETKSNKGNKNGKTRPSNRLLSLLFLSLENSTNAEL